MFLVYIETIKMSIGDERLEKLANAIIFFVTMVEFSAEKTIVSMASRILLMANKQRYVHFISL